MTIQFKGKSLSNSIKILKSPLVLGNPPVWLSSGTIGTYYPSYIVNNQLSIISSYTPDTFSIISGSLFPNLSLSSTGLIYGTITSSVSNNTLNSFIVSATDSLGRYTYATLNISILAEITFGTDSSFVYTDSSVYTDSTIFIL